MTDPDELVITLPDDPEEIIRRLNKVLISAADYQAFTSFHKLIAKKAGGELVPMGFATMFELSLYDFMQEWPHAPVFGAIARMRFSQYVDALIDDKEFAEATKHFYEQVMEEVKGNK